MTPRLGGCSTRMPGACCGRPSAAPWRVLRWTSVERSVPLIWVGRPPPTATPARRPSEDLPRGLGQGVAQAPGLSSRVLSLTESALDRAIGYARHGHQLLPHVPALQRPTRNGFVLPKRRACEWWLAADTSRCSRSYPDGASAGREQGEAPKYDQDWSDAVFKVWGAPSCVPARGVKTSSREQQS